MEYIVAGYFNQPTRDTVQSGVSYLASSIRGIALLYIVRFANAPAIIFAAINGASLFSLMRRRAVKVRILLDAKRQCVSDVTAGYLRRYEQGSESFDRIAVSWGGSCRRSVSYRICVKFVSSSLLRIPFSRMSLVVNLRNTQCLLVTHDFVWLIH